MSTEKQTIMVPFQTAELIRLAFVPRNPNKMRGADPDVVKAAKDFIALVEAARNRAGEEGRA